ncbi:hypothetical protein Tco_0692493 [Tanacetum coccineum]
MFMSMNLAVQGKRYKKNPGEKPLKSSLKKTNYTPSPKDGVDGVDTEDGRNSDFVAGSIQPDDDARSNGDKGTYGNDRQHDGMPHLHSFASFLHAESSQNKVNFHTLETEQSDLAYVLIPISSVLEVHLRFKNTLYGYFLSKKMAYPVVGSYILNAWKKYDVKRVMGDKNGFFFIQFSCANGLEWILEHAGLSAIATRLGTSVMLYLCTVTKCMQSWGRMDYARVLVDIRVDRDLKSIMVISVPNPIGNGVMMHTIKEDNGKPMDDLVDDTRKKVDAPSRKIGIWSGRKADSSKRNVVFSPEMKLHYFDMDDMEFDDIEHVVEETEHGNFF